MPSLFTTREGFFRFLFDYFSLRVPVASSCLENDSYTKLEKEVKGIELPSMKIIGGF